MCLQDDFKPQGRGKAEDKSRKTSIAVRGHRALQCQTGHFHGRLLRQVTPHSTRPSKEMPIVDGAKMACDVCLRGHRGAACPHWDRPLFPVRPRGRPRGKKGQSLDRQRSRSKANGVEADSSTSQTTWPGRCCGSSACKCLRIDDELLESQGCNTCGPGLLQHSLPMDLSDLNVSSSPQSMEYSDLAAPGPSSIPANEPRTPQAVAKSAFSLDLPCTCPETCPCPSCPAHRNRSAQPRKPGQSCCASSSEDTKELVRPPQASGLCGQCLPCIIAPFEDPPASLPMQKQGSGVDNGSRHSNAGSSPWSDGFVAPSKGHELETRPPDAVPSEMSALMVPQTDEGNSQITTSAQQPPPPLVAFPGRDQWLSFHNRHFSNSHLRSWFEARTASSGMPSVEDDIPPPPPHQH